jgi:Ion channel
MTKTKKTVKFGQIIKKLWRKPSFWASVYLALIPTFAFFYYLLPNSFHHGTIRFEQYLEQDKENILKSLKESIVSSFEKKYGAKIATIGDCKMNIQGLDIYNLEVEGKKYSFRSLYSCNKDIDDMLFGKMKLSFYAKKVTMSENSNQTYFIYAEEMQGTSVKMDSLFPGFEKWHVELARDEPEEYYNNNNFGYLTVSPELQNQLIAYADGAAGLPSQSSGSFWRMLYLSAITITTVGFGDIVPITNFARILVSAEAVLGIVLIGLFLNSLAEKIKK